MLRCKSDFIVNYKRLAVDEAEAMIKSGGDVIVVSPPKFLPVIATLFNLTNYRVGNHVELHDAEAAILLVNDDTIYKVVPSCIGGVS